jgi:two-component system alkaline phosphatase synthesis response regulator PhoP
MGYYEDLQKKILIIDDEPDIIEILRYNLEKEGYAVVSADDGETGITAASLENPDLIILDIMMPGMDGVEVCKKIRSKKNLKNILITFLSARAETYSELAGFNAGCDDYMVKPVNIPILLARLKALLRRGRLVEETKHLYKFSNLEINEETMVVLKKGQKIELPKKEFELLLLLVSKPGKVFGRKEIYRKIWRNNEKTNDRVIDVYIRNLRKKIGKKYFKTAKGTGYKFVPH